MSGLIEVQKGTIIKIHARKPPSCDLFYRVENLQPIEGFKLLHGVKGPAIFVDLLLAVSQKDGWPSFSGLFIPADQFDSTTGTAHIESRKFATSAEVIDAALVPEGLIFMRDPLFRDVSSEVPQLQPQGQ